MELHSHNSVAMLTFPPGAGYPRLTRALLAELGELLEEVRLSGLFRGVVIAANARSFATGAAVEEVTAVEGLGARQFAEFGQALGNRIAHFPFPVVAATRAHPWA